MSVFTSMNISATGMTAQRLRMDTISQNIANVNTTHTDTGGPYRRKTVVFEEIGSADTFRSVFDSHMKRNTIGGVKVSRIIADQSPFTTVYDPTHPDADASGYVQMPNVNALEEMTNLIDANRAYEANVTAFNANKGMLSKALEIGG
ncbi:MAG: flagellar basal body rod protein FlgC [Vallitaleaceae bacterium]|jgi:flagellar basal-body rod protein FlgC|nr:flagellar basal body rod protein FlgC [Vallitaleaceae bacterium]